jgi:hypothetical protein
MPDDVAPLADGALAQDLALLSYMLKRHGWTIDLATVDKTGARLAAHRDNPRTLFSDAPNLRDLEK